MMGSCLIFKADFLTEVLKKRKIIGEYF